ncbi:response regulator [Candidatus Magnetominusculus dajiuhuensis]|uniref:hybrid sensor histidine kinase/response regulator n=1 Tax=Candidatus Magnetominusculus dajiuhuensis TaxID=3137712 RepID=UPI003B435691
MTSNKTTVLIVDDDRIIREQLEKEISRGFYNVVTAADGKSAVEALGRGDVSIAIIDINLPDIDGIKLLKKLKGMRPECELIVMTGYGNLDLAVSSLRSGAIDYIEKPFNMEEFHAALGRAQEKLSEKDMLISSTSILIIDDDELVVRRLGIFFKKEDFEVFTASSGRDGLEIIEFNKIDVVITDIRMGDMDGIEVLERAKSYYKDIECIILTGLKDNEYAVKSLRAGAADYITKPINLDELLLSVNKAIERINLNRTRLYRNRELKISHEIITKMHEELERRIQERSSELDNIQAKLFHTSKLTTLGEMSAGIAHEMNQPLGGIALVAKSFRKMLERDRLTRIEIESGLNDIETSVKRMAKIIQHIRTFSRQDTLKFTEVNVVDTLDSAFSLLDEQLRLHEIEVVKEFPSSSTRISGEPFRLEQVWINLITNARDAMNEKSRLIKAIKDPDCANYNKCLKITVTQDDENSPVAVVVSDNGIGMSPTIKERALEPFFTTKEVGQGTGLGLSISYGIIKDHNGRLEIESTEGEGTAVKVLLPRNIPKED